MSKNVNGPSRRTLVKGAAWSVPVVAVAGTAPAFAVSPQPVQFTGQGCKDSSGGQGADYYFWLNVDPTVGPASIGFRHGWDQRNVLQHTGQQPGAFSPQVIDVPAGQTMILIKFSSTTNAANGTLTLTYTYNGTEYTTTVSGEFSSDCHNRNPPITPFGTRASNQGKVSTEVPSDAEATTQDEAPAGTDAASTTAGPDN